MTRIFLLLLAAFLAACGGPNPFDKKPDPNAIEPLMPADAAARLKSEDGLVVIGLSVPQYFKHLGLAPFPYRLTIGWIEFDPKTRMRVGPQFADMSVNCRTSPACGEGGKAYMIFALPPGHYGLGWVTHKYVYAQANFDETQTNFYDGVLTGATFSEKATVNPVLLQFTVDPGKIVYVGDFDANFDDDDKHLIHYGVKRSEEGARAFLAASGLAEHMIVRPMGFAH
jgi:hypothetical protein